MAADIPSVVLNEVITPAWGNVVADSIDEHEARLDAYDAQNLNSRLTTAETDINTVEGWAAPCGAWRSMPDTTGSPMSQFVVGLGPTLVPWTIASWGDTDLTYSAGTFTVGKSGVYIAQVSSVGSANGTVTQIQWRINNVAIGDVLGKPLMWGFGAGTAVTFWAQGSGGTTTMTGGHVQLWRVSPV
jgi:hypothetical protein